MYRIVGHCMVMGGACGLRAYFRAQGQLEEEL